MKRFALAAAALVLFGVGSGRAETLPLLVIPTTYTPGVPVSFEIFAPGLNGLTSYQLDFTVTAGVPTDLPVSGVSASPPTGLSGYPFPDTTQFALAGDVTGNVRTVTITDGTSGAAVNTTAGRDHLATVLITPRPGFTGPITVEFVNAEFDTSRDLTVDLPPAFTISPDTAPPIATVPAPPGVVLLGLGGIGLLAGRRLFARAATA